MTLGRCWDELHYGTVLGTLSLFFKLRGCAVLFDTTQTQSCATIKTNNRYNYFISHLHISDNAPYSPPSKFCVTFDFHFSWVLQPSQEKLKTVLMQIIFFLGGGGGGGGGANKVHYGRCASCVFIYLFSNCSNNIKIQYYRTIYFYQKEKKEKKKKKNYLHHHICIKLHSVK